MSLQAMAPHTLREGSMARQWAHGHYKPVAHAKSAIFTGPPPHKDQGTTLPITYLLPWDGASTTPVLGHILWISTSNIQNQDQDNHAPKTPKTAPNKAPTKINRASTPNQQASKRQT